MKGKWAFIGSIVALLLLELAAGLTQAQGPQPPAENVQPQGGAGIQAAASAPLSASLGTAFTYQGQLPAPGAYRRALQPLRRPVALERSPGRPGRLCRQRG